MTEQERKAISEAEFMAEIDSLINATLAAGDPAPASWITQAIVCRHADYEGPDADHARFCQYKAVRSGVRLILRRYRDGEESGEQADLPGFERLQRAYLVSRNDEQIVVPLAELTIAEIDKKIDELEAMSVGCHEHANELRRYRELKSVAQVSA